MKTIHYTVLYKPSRPRGYTATVPALPEFASKAATLSQARKRVAIELQRYCEALVATGHRLPADVRTRPIIKKITVEFPRR